MSSVTSDGVRVEEEFFRGNQISVITLQGKGYARLKTLAEFYDVSKSEIEKRLKEFSKSHDIEVIEWSRCILLVNVADFHRAVWEFSGRL